MSKIKQQALCCICCSQYCANNAQIEWSKVKQVLRIHWKCNLTQILHQYPSTLILTADHDVLVSPLYSMKFAKSFQYCRRLIISEESLDPSKLERNMRFKKKGWKHKLICHNLISNDSKFNLICWWCVVKDTIKFVFSYQLFQFCYEICHKRIVS